jgi:hypothetical protein
VILTLIQPHWPILPSSHMLKDIPSPALLEIAVKFLDICFWIRDTAKTQQRDYAIDASLLDRESQLVLPQNRGVAKFLDTSWNDFIDVFESSVPNTFNQIRMQRMVWLQSVDLRDIRSSTRARTSFQSLSSSIKVHPVACTRPNVEHGSADRRRHGLVDDASVGYAPVQQSGDAGPVAFANAGSCPSPEGAEPGMLESRPRENGLNIASFEKLPDYTREVEQ